MKSEIEELKRRSTRAEANLELELTTLVEELQITVDSAERKLELLRQANDDQWHAFKDEFETVWNSARGMIRAVTAP